MQKRASGFTLVELSIVLVILGLLVGGILSGQSLIHAAELRAVANERERHLTALHSFRDKYFALPGDMPHATDFWGAQEANNDDCAGDLLYDTPSVDGRTCNGDGNGVIGNPSYDMDPERWWAWQQLAQAGLVEGSFTGVRGLGGTSDSYAQPGVNVPASKFAQSCWSFIPGSGVSFRTSNILSIGVPAMDQPCTAPAFLPEDAYNLDKKIDDGAPYQGSMQVSTYDTSCASLVEGYLLSGQTLGCYAQFSIGY